MNIFSFSDFSDFVARGTYSFQLCEINAQRAGKKNARTVWCRIMLESTPSLHQHSGPFRGNLCEQVPPLRYSSLALEYVCIFLSWLIFSSSAGFSFLWFTSTIIVAKRAWRLLLLHLGGRTLRVGCGGPIGQHTATPCQRFVKCGTGKGLTRSSRRWGSCHVYDDS